MELRLLRYFLAVAREENITRASESLHITEKDPFFSQRDFSFATNEKLLS